MRMKAGWKKRTLAIALSLAVLATTITPTANAADYTDGGLVVESTASSETELSGEGLIEPSTTEDEAEMTNGTDNIPDSEPSSEANDPLLASENSEDSKESSTEATSEDAANEKPEFESEINEERVNSYLSIIDQLPDEVTIDNYVNVMQLLAESKDLYDAMTAKEQELWRVFAATQRWKAILESSYLTDASAITDGWNLLLKTGGYPSPYEEGGIFLRETGTYGSAFGGIAYDIGSNFRKATNRSKNANAYVQWPNGAYMNDKLYDVRVYYWCPDGDYYISSSGNMTAHNNGWTQKIFMEFHFFEAGHMGDWNYEVDFYGVMGSRDLDYCGGSEFEGWYFPVNGMGQNENDSSTVKVVYSSADTIMSIRRDNKIQTTTNTHINGTQQSKTYSFLPYWATTKDSRYGWDDYACLFWTFSSKKSDPMVLAYHTWGSLMAGLNGDPVVVRYYLTADSEKPSGVLLPGVQYTSYGAEFSRFANANTYKGYTFEGWSLNKNMDMSTENNISAGMSGLVKASTANLAFKRNNGTYAIGETQGGSVYTLYGAQSSWYGMSLATGLMNGTFEWDEDCGVTYNNGYPSFTASTYGTNRRILLYGRYKLWTGKVQITKSSSLDPNIKIPGAVYGLYSDSSCKNLLARATTNDSGAAVFDYTITYNTNYYIKEMIAPQHYQLSNTVYTVKGDALGSDGGTVNVNVSDSPWTGTLELRKYSSIDLSTPISGAIYGLYSDAACNNKLSQATTNADGVATFSTTPIAYGVQYYVKEINAPAGWLLDETVYTIPANSLTSNGETLRFTVLNKPAYFNITTDVINGTIDQSLANVPLGGNRTINSTANTGYVLQSVTIDDNIIVSNSHTDTSYSYTFSNISASHSIKVTYIAGGYIEINKSGANSGESIGNATYTIYSDANCTNAVTTLVTDANGYAKSIPLAPGTYYVKETQAPIGYELNTNVETATITSGSTYSLKDIHEEEEWKANIFITKTDDSGNPLSDATMDVHQWSEESNQYVKLKTMKSSGGVYTASDIPYTDDNQGSFKVVETKNPAGYTGSYEQEFEMDLSMPAGSSQTFTFAATAVNSATRYKFVKVDEVGNPVPDCNFVICPGTNFDWFSRVADWNTDSTGIYVLEGVLEAGKTYTLYELYCPNGYYQSKNITFTVPNTSEEQVITIVNKSGYRCSIWLEKQILEKDIVWEHGEPTFIFKTTGTDYEGKSHVFHTVVTLPRETYEEVLEYGDAYVDYGYDGYSNSYTYVEINDGIVSLWTSVKVKPGTYTTSEISTSRYRLARINNVYGGEISENGKAVVFDLYTHDDVEATFCNVKVEQQNYSHSDLIINHIGYAPE